MGNNGNSDRLFIFLGSKITADGEIKRCLLLGRKAVTNLDSILKGRDITLPTKVHLVKAVVFPVVMYECERWTVKKAEGQRIDAFEMCCCRGLLRACWTARKFNHSILHEINPGYSLEGLMLKPKLQYFGHRMRKTDWIWKDPNAGKDWRWEEKWSTEDEMVGWHHRLTGHKFEQALGIGDGQGGLVHCGPWDHKESDMTEQLNWLNWNEEVWVTSGLLQRQGLWVQ